MQAPSAEPFVMPPYDETSFAGVRAALKDLARYTPSLERSFGAAGDVDPVHHLIGSSAAWGGLPEREAIYLNVEPRLPVGRYRLTIGEVPVDGFWSISVYDADGYFEKNDAGTCSMAVTAEPNPDGSITVHFGGCGDERPNCLPVMDGWNYIVRLYRPRQEILDGTWSFPSVEVADRS